MMIESDTIRSILVIKLGGLGDVFLSTIVIESLRNHFPDARVEYLVEKAGRDAIINDERIGSVYIIDKQTMTPIEIVRHVRRQKYDLVIDLFGNPRSAIITFLGGARHTAGLDYGWRKHLYSIVGEARREELHGAEVNLQALKALHVPIVDAKLRYPLSVQDTEHAEAAWRALRLADRFVVGILPAGSWPSKRCEPEKFAEIGLALHERYDATILVVWGPTDEQDARSIQSLCGSAAVLAPRATLSQNIALLSRCNAIVANDSGPMHLASAFAVPILCLYGPTFPEGPYGTIHSWVRNEGLECLVCNHLHCPIQHQCMRDLPVGAVIEKFDAMMKKRV